MIRSKNREIGENCTPRSTVALMNNNKQLGFLKRKRDLRDLITPLGVVSYPAPHPSR